MHLGVTEAGDGEDGRVKSAAGIGTLLEDGIGDTVRVSLTEDPEFEIPVCRDLVKRYSEAGSQKPEVRNPTSDVRYQQSAGIEQRNNAGEIQPSTIPSLSSVNSHLYSACLIRRLNTNEGQQFCSR